MKKNYYAFKKYFFNIYTSVLKKYLKNFRIYYRKAFFSSLTQKNIEIIFSMIQNIA